MYSREASPSCTRCMDSDLVIGSSIPFIVTASVMPRSARLSIWSFMRDCKGEMTTVSPWTERPAMNAGS